MATEGIQVKNDFLGFAPDPQIEKMAVYSAAEYEKKQIPEAAKIIGAIQSPSPDNNMAAADAIKKMSGVDQPQWMNVIQSVINMNPREAAIFMNGGADVPTQAFDANGKQWIKVFNERRTKQNPNGEERYYIDPENGRKLSRGELDKAGIGPIVSVQEIPVTQQNWYVAKGLQAKDAAQNQIAEWNKNQKISAATMRNGDLIRDTSDQLDKFYSDPAFVQMSVSPQVRELVGGINEMRTGNVNAVRNSAEMMKKSATGNRKASEVNDSIKQSGGITFGLNYNEGKGWTKADGTVATTDEIENASKAAQASLSSENQISSRKNDLLQRAQLAAANGQLKNIDAIQQVINLEYQKALAIQEIENAGGIGIARPSLAHEVGDSFSLAGVKNKMSRNYGELASFFGNQVQAFKDANPNKVPAVGDVEALIKSNPVVRESRLRTQADIERYLDKVEPAVNAVNAMNATNVVRQPTAEMTTTGGVGVAPTAVAGKPEVSPIAGAKAPTARESKPAATTTQESMADIRARLKKQREGQ